MATTALRRPVFSSSSMIARCSLDTEPWWARAMTSGAPREAPLCAISCAGGFTSPGGGSASPVSRSQATSLSRCVRRSASRRELENTIVERCASIRSAMRSSTCGQIEVRGSAPAAEPSNSAVGTPSSRMSSTGTTTEMSNCLSDGGFTTTVSAAPPRKRATSSTGRTVADNPIRCAGFSSSASRRSRDSARCAPRLVAATACTSSMITVCDAGQGFPGPRGEDQEQRLRRGDEDVRRPGGELAPLVGRRVPGAHADLDARLG